MAEIKEMAEKIRQAERGETPDDAAGRAKAAKEKQERRGMADKICKRIGNRTFEYTNRPCIIGAGSVAGEMEGQGPQAKWFDMILQDDSMGEETWEKSESKMFRTAVEYALKDAGLHRRQIDAILCGDLLNQLMASSFMVRDLNIPFLGLYGACSTMTESMLVGGAMVDGGYCRNVLAGASSHFSTAERQFRLPLEHGNQRDLTAQWTATASGAVVISSERKSHICLTHATIGRIVDPGITDSNCMGAAMAPAAFDTIRNHLEDLGRTPKDYDLILTGDLGNVGRRILVDFSEQGSKLPELKSVYDDCGSMIFDTSKQDVHSGGSGCGCSGSSIAGRICRQMEEGKIRRAMLISTGALMSTISSQQGESIPGIAHAVTIEYMP